MIRVLLRDLKAALAGEATQFVELGLRVLIDRGDSHIKSGTLHRDAPRRYLLSILCSTDLKAIWGLLRQLYLDVIPLTVKVFASSPPGPPAVRGLGVILWDPFNGR